MHTRYFNNVSKTAETLLLGNFKLISADSEVIYTLILDYFNINFVKLIGFCSDGRSVMTGNVKGVEKDCRN